MKNPRTTRHRHITSVFSSHDFSKNTLWRVICHKGVTVRQKFDPYSKFVALLTPGTVVDVVKQKDNRLKICKPVDGWVVLQMLDEEYFRLEKISSEGKEARPSVLRRMKSMPEVVSPPKMLQSRSDLLSSDTASDVIDSPVKFLSKMDKSKSVDQHGLVDSHGFRRITFNSPEENVMDRLDNAPKITCDMTSIKFDRGDTEELNLDLDFPDLGDSSNDGCSDTLSPIASPASKQRSPSLWNRRKKKSGLGTEPGLGNTKMECAKSFKFDKTTGVFSLLDQEVETSRQETYNIVTCAYHGTNSSVYKVSDNSSKKDMALKSIDIQNPSARRMVYCEIKILRSLQHPNIVKFYDVAFNPKTSTISILLEWMESGCLTDVVKISGALKPARIRKIARDILNALHYVHEQSIIHRDIKPDNVLLAENAAKLADFGIAKLTSEKDVFISQEIGTLNYMAPERLHAQEYDFSSDVWSFGAMIYYLAEGKTKYSGFEKLTDLIDTICHKRNLPRLAFTHPPQLQEFVGKCCAYEKSERPTCKALLKSKFFNKDKCMIS